MISKRWPVTVRASRRLIRYVDGIATAIATAMMMYMCSSAIFYENMLDGRAQCRNVGMSA